MDTLDFFFDPICPWAWIASRWIQGLADQGLVKVNWRFISLKILNSTQNYALDFPAGYSESHGLGHSLLRIAAASREHGGNDAVERFYTVFGTELHENLAREEFINGKSMQDVASRAKLDFDFEAARDDANYDLIIGAETELALSRAGREVGTPIITFGPPDGPSLFGPVMSSIPTGQDSIDLYHAYRTLARREDFYELKRSVRKMPSFK